MISNSVLKKRKKEPSDTFVEDVVALLAFLKSEGYWFYAPTPETHAKVLCRLAQQQGDAEPRRFDSTTNDADQVLADKICLTATNSEEVWGWSLPTPLMLQLEVLPQVKEHYPNREELFIPRERIRGEASSHSTLDGIDNEKDDAWLPVVRVSNLYLPSIKSGRPGYAAHPCGGLQRDLDRDRSQVLYAHSAFPTFEADSVFFGPDTYRFIRFLREALAILPTPPTKFDGDGEATERAKRWKLAVDVGTGAGAGAIALAGLMDFEGVCKPRSPDELVSEALSGADAKYLIGRVVGTDINAKALRFARANSRSYEDTVMNPRGWHDHLSSRVSWRECSLLSGLDDEERKDVDLIVSNPPYIAFGDKDDGDNEETRSKAHGKKATHDNGAAPRKDTNRKESKRADRAGGRGNDTQQAADEEVTVGRGAKYADGGDQGIALPLLILRKALEVLRPGGVVLLYTGVPVSIPHRGMAKDDERNPLWAACREIEQRGDATIDYWDTLDTDVFGDELGPGGTGSGGYDNTRVGRIEVVGVGLRKRAHKA